MSTQKRKTQSHNLTKEELKELQYNQVNGDVEKVKANKNADFEINAYDAHLIHALIETPQFDPNTGQRLSKPIVQTFYPHEFDAMEKQHAFTGKTLEIIHQPSEYDPSKARAAGDAEVNRANKGANIANSNLGNNTQGGGDLGKEKPVSQMNKAELTAKYKQLYGEDPDKEATNPELKEAIQDKLDEANNTQGGGDGENQDNGDNA